MVITYQCSLCNDSFYKVNSLIMHLKIIHKFENNSVFGCRVQSCRRSFPSANSFRKHLKAHENKTLINLTDTFNSDNSSVIGAEQSQTSLTDVVNNVENAAEDQNPSEIFEKFQRKLLEKSTIFICRLYLNTSFCRKDIQVIIDFITDLLFQPMDMLKYNILESIFKASSDQIFNVNRHFDEFHNIFENFSSEFKRFKYLETLGCFVKPETYVVGQNLERRTNSIPFPKKYTAEYIPMNRVLTKFFQLPGVYNHTLKYLDRLSYESDNISNIVQTNYWKTKILNHKTHNLLLPIFIYYDDFESGNPLGSHAGIHKIGAIYYSVGCLPPQFQSHLENIFVANLFHSSDLKQFGEKIMFSKLVSDINILQDQGITVHVEDKTVKIHFRIASFLGDNLGLNTILGFQESFSANSFCRFCKCLKADTQKLNVEINSALRNLQNYNIDLELGNPYLTGIKFTPILNAINNFHVVENFAVDIAHDIFEGVGAVDMAEILYQFIFVDKYFDIKILNSKLRYFNFGSGHNKPPTLAYENIKRKNLRMSAAEMKNFILSAGLIFGHLVPMGNKFWELYLTLRKILKIVLNDTVTETLSEKLTSLIKTHHSLFLELIKTPLRPKYHILTHYPSVMMKSGPLKNITTLRYESKHRTLKSTANVISSRINITRSISINHQLEMACRFALKIGFMNDNIVFSKYDKAGQEFLLSFTDLIKQCTVELKTKMEQFITKNIKLVTKIVCNNLIYRVNDVIVLKTSDSPSFGIIKTIVLNDINEICIIYYNVEVVQFNDHLFAYEVNQTSITQCFMFEGFLDIITLTSRQNKTFASL